jgi:aspartate/tyrosine/aromatic aminotransferase
LPCSLQAPPDAILGVTEAWKACSDPKKLNLGVGAYRDEAGKPVVLRVVHDAEERILADPAGNHEYLPIGGLPEFCRAAAELAYGKDSPALAEGRIAILQSLSGTGSLRVGGEFLSRFYPNSKIIYVPDPTWANHHAIFQRAGLEVRKYRYYHPATRGLDFEGMKEDLAAAPEGAVVLLHACAHNPTGVDPTPEQWQGILDVVKFRQLLPFFDSAYQGFASGDLDRDGAALRLFANSGLEMLLAQSFAKNMGLYGERVGTISAVIGDAAVKGRVESQLRVVARAMYSNPPKHGAAVASAVLNDPDMFARWQQELKGMADRIITMRHKLKEELLAAGAPGSWDHIVDQIGMFSYTGLTPEQVAHMTEKWHVFMTRDGRISMAGLSGEKCKYLAEAMKDAMTSVKSNL